MVILPDLPDNIGKRRRAKHPDGTFFYFKIVDEIKFIQSTHEEKAIYLQKNQFEETQRIEFRLGYYIIGKKPKMAGKWVWGQFATMLPAEDFVRIIHQAQDKGWFQC